MPRLLASMIRFSIWSDMPRPWRPPIALASVHQVDRRSANSLPLIATGRPWSKPTVTSSAAISTDGSQNRTPMIGSTISMPVSRCSSGLGLVGGAPDVGVGGVRLLGAVAVRAGRARASHSRHLRAAAELGDEVGVEPRLVDAQVRVGEQAVAVEPLDVVALVGRAVAPDLDAVVVHRPHQQRAGDGAAERRGVEVGRARRSGCGRRRRCSAARPSSTSAARQSTRRAISAPYCLRPAGHRRRCRARRTGRGRRCRCTGRRPCRASTRPRPRCRGRRRRRCRRARRRAGR